MTWTSPMTAIAGTVFTAAEYNRNIRDNLLETAPAKATTVGHTFDVGDDGNVHETSINDVQLSESSLDRDPQFMHNFLENPGALIYRTSPLSIPAGSWRTVVWDGPFHRNDLNMINGNFLVNIRKSGMYDIGCHIIWPSNTTGTQRAVQIVRNEEDPNVFGLKMIRRSPDVNPAIGRTTAVETRWWFPAGSTLSAHVWHNATTTLNLQASAQAPCKFWVMRVKDHGD